MKHKFSLIILFCILTIGSIWFVGNSSAFTGPQSGSAGDQPGLFITNGTNLKIGGSATLPSTLLNSTKLTVVASSGFPYDYLLKLVVDENDFNSPILSVNNAGGVSIGTNSSSINAAPNPSGDGYKRLYVKGTLVADEINIANCTGSGCGGGSVAQLSSGVFGSTLPGSSTMLYAFPSSVGIGTSTQVGLPQALSVYGGGYFSKSVGIGTTTLSGTLATDPGLVIDMPNQAFARFFELKNRASPTSDAWSIGNGVLGQLDYLLLYNKNLGTGNPMMSFLRNNSGIVGVGIKGVPWPNSALEVGGDMKVYATTTLATTGGNVGINTTNPTQKLHVLGNAIISDQLLVATTTLPASGFKLVVDGSVKIGTVGNYIQFPDGTTQSTAYNGISGPSGSGTAGRIPKWATSNSLTDSVIYESSTSTNVGIGASPNSSYKLDISGTMRSTGNAIFNSYVGMGVTSPGARLEVQAVNGADAIRIRKVSGGSGSVDLFTVLGSGGGTGNSWCASTAAQSLCLGAWDQSGIKQACTTTASAGQYLRALCADFGD